MKTEEQNESLEQKLALMFWKLCLGDPNHILLGEGIRLLTKQVHTSTMVFVFAPYVLSRLLPIRMRLPSDWNEPHPPRKVKKLNPEKYLKNCQPILGKDMEIALQSKK